MSKFFSSIWAWLDGKKRTIAVIYWTVVTPTLPIMYPTGIPSEIGKVYLLVGILLSALGLGHAAVKSYLESNGTPEVATEELPKPPAE